MKKILTLLLILFTISCTKEVVEPITQQKDYSEIGVWRYYNSFRKESYTFYVTKDSIATAHIYPNKDSVYLITAYTLIHRDTILEAVSKNKIFLKAENDSVLYYNNLVCFKVK